MAAGPTQSIARDRTNAAERNLVSDQKLLLVAALGVMLAYNAVDLVAWRLVMQDVKVELKLSDTQLGLLSGFAYSLLYAVMGLPLARWADRGYRVAIISVSAALSGLMVALIGTAQSFAHLLLIRTLVAVGDAGSTPASQSLIASHFSRSARPHATSLMLLGGSISGVLAPPLAGWLNEAYGWRATFVAIGLPGLALAAIAWWILRTFETGPQPSRPLDGSETVRGTEPYTAAAPSARDVFVTLWSLPTFRFVLLGWLTLMFLGSGLAKWEAVFFRRVHVLQTGELGLWIGFVTLAGLAGIYGGGYLASRYAPNNERLQLKAMGIAYAAYSILAICVYMAPDYRIAFAFAALKIAGGSMVMAPLYALLQSLVPAHMRATAFAVLMLFGHLIGGGIGPIAVGAASDVLEPLLGSESLRYALIAACTGFPLAGWLLWQASRTVMYDIARASETRSATKPGTGLGHGSSIASSISPKQHAHSRKPQ